MKAIFSYVPSQVLILLLLLGAAFRANAAAGDLIVYDDARNNWDDYGWASIVRDYANTAPVHSGTHSIAVGCAGFEALYLHHGALTANLFSSLSFWINGGPTGGQLLKVQGTLSGTAQTEFHLPALPQNTWTNIIVPLTSLGVDGAQNFDGFWIQNQTGSTLPTFYVDDITLLAATNAVSATNAVASITVNAGTNRHSISPLIYGVAFASTSQAADLNVPLNRSGGNAETRYNWLIDAHNRGADFFFESIGDSSGTPGASDDTFVSQTKAAGAQPLLTIPMIGWAPKLGPGRAKLASYSIAKYGPQTGSDSSFFPDAGNGIRSSDGSLIVTNDPNDANFLTNSFFQKQLVQHLVGKWGASTNGGVKYYLMDNEHSIWFSTHRDVHPVGPTMQEMRDKFLDYASTVKSVDPGAMVMGMEEWGFVGYLTSGYDQQWSSAHNNFNQSQYPDRGTNGGMDYMPWMLNQIYQHDLTNHQRLLDYFTVHYYPQSGESGDDVSSSEQLLRNRSTRSLWDPTYVDVSYINQVVQLVPRLRGWVNTYYPGTKIAVTEYNWGAEANINGATTQADIDGIFGRENLDLATRWTTPAANTPTYLAMKMYRNYDGNKSTFGDVSVSASGPNPDNVSTFAAQRSTDGSLTIMVVSKYLTGATPVAVTISNFFGLTGPAQVWQLNSSNVIAHLSDVPLTGNTINTVVPGQSVTLFIVKGKPFVLQSNAAISAGNLTFSLNGQIGQSYILLGSTDLVSWSPVSTNMLTATQMNFQISTTGTQQFFRIQQAP